MQVQHMAMLTTCIINMLMYSISVHILHSCPLLTFQLKTH